MIFFLTLTSIAFSMLGFIIGVWANDIQKLQLVPLLVITPLTFLGGAFYSIDMLPPLWQTILLFNSVVYLISAFNWGFYGVDDVNVVLGAGMILVLWVTCLLALDFQDWLPHQGINA